VKTEAEKMSEDQELKLQLMAMSERQRRSYFRKLGRNENARPAEAGDDGYVTSGDEGPNSGSDSEDGEDGM
jgi:hypothetical protein